MWVEGVDAIGELVADVRRGRAAPAGPCASASAPT